MASFFQPGLQDPVLEDCDGSSGFQVYCNSILPSASRFGNLYQLVILVLGATCIVVPSTLYLIHVVFQKRFSYLLRKQSRSTRYVILSSGHKPLYLHPSHFSPTARSNDDEKALIQPIKKGARLSRYHDGDASTLSRTLVKRPRTSSFRSTKSFCVVSDSEGSETQAPSRGYDLVIIPASMGEGVSNIPGDSHSISSYRTVLNEIPAKLTLAHIRMEDYELQDLQLTEASHSLALAQTLNDWAGFALECTSTQQADRTNYLLACLASIEVPVILVCQHDCEAIDDVDLSIASGLIVENACILSNGQRRDYFKARRLRDTMARCTLQRDKRPDFFVGFLDRWETQPMPSVVRRAAKIAQHFDAVIEHGPIAPTASGKASSLESASKTMSAFEYLRRAEMVEVRSRLSQLTELLLTFNSCRNVGHLENARYVSRMVPMTPTFCRSRWLSSVPSSPKLQSFSHILILFRVLVLSGMDA